MDKTLERLGHDLACLGAREDAHEYFRGCAKASLAAFVAGWLLWSLLFDGILEGLLFASACSAACLFALLSLPRLRLEARARRIEKHLPFALMQLSVEQNIAMPFSDSLARVADSDYGDFSEGLKARLRSARMCGSSIPEALIGFANANRSRLLRRAVSQMVSLYEHGPKSGAGEPLREMALELLSRQKSQAKEFSARISAFSVAFVVASAVIPALFQAYTIVGSAFMEIPLSGTEILLIVAGVFPLADICLLLLAKSMTPESLKG